jgi:hypothetical protein
LLYRYIRNQPFHKISITPTQKYLLKYKNRHLPLGRSGAGVFGVP